MSGTKILHIDAQEISDAVTAREYLRLLQLPRDFELEGDLLERATNAREWYAKKGTPFLAAGRVELENVGIDTIRLANGMDLHSLILARRLQAGEAHALTILTASAGPEVADEISQMWAAGKPDEAFFLDRFAVGITERLIFWASATICRNSEGAGETLLPHLSPGCGNWDLADQHKLMSILSDGGTEIGAVRMLESGALHPQHSIMAALGVTHRKVANSPELICRSCDLTPCNFRRAPFGGEALRLLR